MGYLDDVQLSISDRLYELEQSRKQLQSGAIGPAEHYIEGTAQGMGALADPIAVGMMNVGDAVIPEWAQQGMKDIAAGIMNSGPAQAALKLAQENPRVASVLGNVLSVGMDAAGASGVSRAPKGMFDAAARNMPNELPGFYGSGQGGKAASVIKGAATMPYHAAKELLPSNAAKVREGVSPRLSAVAKKALLADADFSFPLGQAGQDELLRRGKIGKKQHAAMDDIMGGQTLHTGMVDEGAIKKAFEVYEPQRYEGMDMQGVAERFETEAMRALKTDGTDMVVGIRHPTALTNFSREAGGASNSSISGRRLYKAKTFLPKGQTEFTEQGLREFVAMRFVGDTGFKRVDGKPMTKTDHRRLKYSGPGEQYTRSQGNIEGVTEYFKLKDKLRAGKKLTGPQAERYQGYRAAIEREAPKVRIDEQGRAWFTSYHKSAAKDLGGVGDVFMIDRKGNMLHGIVDENDLFGMKVPGDKRSATVTAPTRTNMFGTWKTPPVSELGQAKAKYHRTLLENKYNAPDQGGSATARQKQATQAIANVKGKTQLSDYEGLATTGMLGGLMGAGALEE